VEILADHNSKVEAGQVVARLNSDQIRARLDAARADLEQMRALKLVHEAQIERVRADTEKARAAEADAQAQVARNEALLADTERAFQRQSDLRARGVASEAAHDSARAARDAQRASLESARAQLNSAGAQLAGLAADLRVAHAHLTAAGAQIAQREAAVRQIEVDLSNTDIRSPVSGVVVQRQVELGQTVAASLQSPTLFLIADDLRRMEVSANIDEADVGRIRPGQRATFTVSAFPGRMFAGTVKQVRLGSQTVQNVVIYTAIIAVENPHLEFMPGMTATLRIETDRRDAVVQIPNAALRWRPPAPAAETPSTQAFREQERGGTAGQIGRVFVVGTDGRPQGVTVRIGASHGSATEIVAGLDVGREVIIGGGRL
jgi:HlyD family secretion protein